MKLLVNSRELEVKEMQSKIQKGKVAFAEGDVSSTNLKKRGELEVKEVQSKIQKGKVAFAEGDVSSTNLKSKICNMIPSGTPSRKRKGEMISLVSTQKGGELEVKVVQPKIQKGKVAFAEGDVSSTNLKPKICNMSPSGTPSRKRKGKMISSVSTQKRGELEVKEVQSKIQKGKVAFSEGDVSSTNLKPKICNMSRSGTPSRKRKGEMISPVSTQKRGKLEVKVVRSKRKVAFVKGATNIKDKIGRKRPSGTTSEERKGKKLSPVATPEISGLVLPGEEYDYDERYIFSDNGDWPKGALTFLDKKYEEWDIGDWMRASTLPYIKDLYPDFNSKIIELMGDWEL